jgi:predicted RNA binding protein YcfA (HicA-like mRNA interferase family)
LPKFRDLKNYCERTGWELYKEKSDHYYYRKILLDGTVLRTKISHVLGKEIPYHLFHEILKDQLKITKEEFNKNS